MKYVTLDNRILPDIDVSNYKRIGWGCYNSKLNILTLCGQEDEYINGQYPQKPIVTNFDLSSGQKKVIFNSLVYDCLWNEEENSLIYSTGNTICRYIHETSSNEKLFKFTSVRYAPINPCLSPSRRYLSFLKFKSDSRVLQILNLDTNENLDTKTSCSSYHWLNDEEIIFAISSGKIKTYNISTKRVQQSPINLKYILKQKDKKVEDVQLLINKLPEEQKSWTSFHLPRIYNGRIYFLFYSGGAKVTTLNSVNFEFKDFRQEFSSNDVIDHYWYLDNKLCLYMNKVIEMRYNYYILNQKEAGFQELNEIAIVSKSDYSDNQIKWIKATNKGYDVHGGV